MDDTMRTALEASIKKWADILDGSGRDNGTENCALCKEYYNIEWAQGATVSDRCEGCPVKQRTGRRWCQHSPYQDWANHHDYEHDSDDLGDLAIVSGCNKCRKLAQAEHDFLVSLLPSEGESDHESTQ